MRILISSFIIGLISIPTAFAFSDGSNSLFSDGIQYVKDQNIVQGYEDGTYKPEKTINRAEFIKIVIEALFPEEIKNYSITTSCFPDVPVDAWFAKYVCFAKEKGIIGGYPDGTFGPEGLITLSEAAKILIEAFGHDVGSDPIWYKPYILKLIELKALPETISGSGYYLNRGEMANMIFGLQTGDYDPIFSPSSFEALEAQNELEFEVAVQSVGGSSVSYELRDRFREKVPLPENIELNLARGGHPAFFNGQSKMLYMDGTWLPEEIRKPIPYQGVGVYNITPHLKIFDLQTQTSENLITFYDDTESTRKLGFKGGKYALAVVNFHRQDYPTYVKIFVLYFEDGKYLGKQKYNVNAVLNCSHSGNCSVFEMQWAADDRIDFLSCGEPDEKATASSGVENLETDCSTQSQYLLPFEP